jgi:ankyrin repeat protein
MMVSDNEGKNSLHWASQFGNSKTGEFILSRMNNLPVMQAKYVALANSDGWTPLCWAVRPCNGALPVA